MNKVIAIVFTLMVALVVAFLPYWAAKVEPGYHQQSWLDTWCYGLIALVNIPTCMVGIILGVLVIMYLMYEGYLNLLGD